MSRRKTRTATEVESSPSSVSPLKRTPPGNATPAERRPPGPAERLRLMLASLVLTVWVLFLAALAVFT